MRPASAKNLQDHPDFIFGFTARSLDLVGFSLAGAARLVKEIGRYRREGRGMITSNFAEVGGFLKTRPDLPEADIQLHFVVAIVENHARTLRRAHGYSCHFCLLRPHSRGSVTLRDANPLSPPLIDPNFLSDARDVEDMVAGYKLTRRLLDAPALASRRDSDLYTGRCAQRRRYSRHFTPAGRHGLSSRRLLPHGGGRPVGRRSGIARARD